ncbi:MAG: saccharopine dehydrogenase NADP-binding domain-containing protein [Cytophagales bacterium]|nr:saccharopine dehydrogenase NADP-binding domain-containing protein [Cytophagales bacterium]
MDDILVYGANGFTAQLVIAELVNKGLRPTLAGRSKKIIKIAQNYGLNYKIFEIWNKQNTIQNIDGHKLLINLAGPYHDTFAPILEACLATHTHYIDAEGDVHMLQEMYRYHEKTVKAEIMLLPGVGFAIAPTDILGYMLTHKIEHGVQLKYAIHAGIKASKGTIKSFLHSLQTPGLTRADKNMITSLPAAKKMDMQVLDKKFKTYLHPWRGDSFASWLSCGVPDIETYSTFPAWVVLLLKNYPLSVAIGKWKIAKKIITAQGMQNISEADTTTQCYLSATLTSKSGENYTLKMIGPEPYLFTSKLISNAAQKVLDGKYKIGYQTPATAYGATLIDNIEGVKLIFE